MLPIDLPRENIYYKTKHGILYCGDCMEILQDIPNKTFDILITDLPYCYTSLSGAGCIQDRYEYRKEDLLKLSHFEPEPFLELIKTKLKYFHAYIWTDKNLLLNYLQFIKSNNYNFDILVWVKNNPIPAYHNTYLKDIEFCLFIREKSRCTFNNGLGYDIYRKAMIDNVSPYAGGHPTAKHLWMIEKFLMVSTKEGDIVIDPFLGSGTTAVACEKMKRYWVGIEIEEKYCKIAVERIKTETRQLRIFNF